MIGAFDQLERSLPHHIVFLIQNTGNIFSDKEQGFHFGNESKEMIEQSVTSVILPHPPHCAEALAGRPSDQTVNPMPVYTRNSAKLIAGQVFNVPARMVAIYEIYFVSCER